MDFIDYIYNCFTNHTVEAITISLSFVALIISGISAYFAYISWHKSKAIYDIEVKLLWVGNVDRHKINEELKKKIKTGNYTILHVTENNGGYVRVVIGKIKE